MNVQLKASSYYVRSLSIQIRVHSASSGSISDDDDEDVAHKHVKSKNKGANLEGKNKNNNDNSIDNSDSIMGSLAAEADLSDLESPAKKEERMLQNLPKGLQSWVLTALRKKAVQLKAAFKLWCYNSGVDYRVSRTRVLQILKKKQEPQSDHVTPGQAKRTTNSDFSEEDLEVSCERQIYLLAPIISSLRFQTFLVLTYHRY